MCVGRGEGVGHAYYSALAGLQHCVKCKLLATMLLVPVQLQLTFEEDEERRKKEAAAAKPAEQSSGFLSFGRLEQLGK